MDRPATRKIPTDGAEPGVIRSQGAPRRLRVGRMLHAALLVAALAAPAASADARADAKRHFREGMSLIDAGQIERGIVELKQAYAIKPHPDVLYDIAKAYLDLGSVPDAIEYFHQYVATDPADKQRVQGVIQRLEATIASAAAARAASAASVGEPARQAAKEPPKPAQASQEGAFEAQTISAPTRATLREIAAELTAEKASAEDMFDAQTISAPTRATAREVAGASSGAQQGNPGTTH